MDSSRDLDAFLDQFSHRRFTCDSRGRTRVAGRTMRPPKKTKVVADTYRCECEWRCEGQLVYLAKRAWLKHNPGKAVPWAVKRLPPDEPQPAPDTPPLPARNVHQPTRGNLRAQLVQTRPSLFCRDNTHTFPLTRFSASQQRECCDDSRHAQPNVERSAACRHWRSTGRRNCRGW